VAGILEKQPVMAKKWEDGLGDTYLKISSGRIKN
jgi:hypothetical protein